MMRIIVALLALCFAGIAGAQNLPPPTAWLLSNASATGAATYWPGGIGVFTCVGTFNGATVTMEYLGPDGVTYVVAGTNTTLTAAGNGVFYLPASYLKAVISGATPSGMYCSVSLVQRY